MPMATDAADPPVTDHQTVFAEQVKLVYQLGGVGAFTVMLLAWLYALLVWPLVPNRELLLWTMVITLVSVVRMALAYYRKRHAIDSDLRAWGWGLIALASATGLLWAYAGTVLFPHGNTDMQLIAAFILVGTPAGAVASFGPYLMSYVCYVTGAILPFGI